MKLTIGLSYAPGDNEKYRKYWTAVENAAKSLEYEIEIVDLYASQSRIAEVDGVIFTGGADVDPARYGKQEELRLCKEIDELRDQEEFELATKAEERSLPVLGICRGMQLLNVHRGGTLVTDIQNFGGSDHTKIGNDDRRHTVNVTPGSQLRRTVGVSDGEINSAHHQAVERAGEGLTISARAVGDGVAEALEWQDPKGKPFFLAVQWHPERMEYEERFSGRLFESFLWEVGAHKLLRDRIGTLTTRMPDEARDPSGAESQDETREVPVHRNGQRH
jgi:putative glutamine amidotransferase